MRLLIYGLLPNNIAVGYLLIFLTGYLPEVRFNPEYIGFLIGLQGLVLILSSIPFGIVSDRRGRRDILLLGTVFVAPSILIFSLTTNIVLLSVSAITFGLAEAAALSTWNAIIADQTELENRDAAFSLSFIVSTCGVAFGSMIPLFLPAVQGLSGIDSATIHRSILAIAALCSLVSAAAVRLALRDYKERHPGHRALVRGKNFGTLIRFSGINSLIGLGAGFIVPIITTWFYLRFQLPDSYTGTILAVSSIVMALAATISPRLSVAYGPVRSILMTQSLSTVFMLSVALLPTAFLAATTYVVRAALMNMSAPLVDSYLMSLMSPEERGLASSLNSIIWRIPNSASTFVGGFLLATGHLALPFFIAAGLYLVSISLFYYNFRTVHPKG